MDEVHPDLENKLQLYVKKLREGGGVVSSKIVVAAAKGVIAAYDQSSLVEFGGHIHLTRHWAYSLLHRMKFVQRKVTTAKSKYSVADFDKLKESFLQEVITTVEMEEIPPDLILNWDQTGVKIVPSNTWTMDRRGSKRVEIAGANDKRAITAVFCGSLVGDFLPLQLIYKGKTRRCHPRYQFPSNWDITHSPRHWSNEDTMIQYITNIVLPYVRRVREDHEHDTPALIIMDNFKGQVTTAVTSLMDENNLHVCLLPANTTDRLQPMDLSVNKAAKAFLRQKFEKWYSDQIVKQLKGKNIEVIELQPIPLDLVKLKELMAQWLVEMADYIADNPLIIVNGFIKAGIPGALDSEQVEESELENGQKSDEDESDEEESDGDESEEEENEDEFQEEDSDEEKLESYEESD